MDTKSLETLELGMILERLSDHAAFSASKALALDLEPSSDQDLVSQQQRETSEARYLFSVNSSLSVGGAHDVRPLVEGASRGVVLEATDCLDIKSTIIAGRNLRRILEATRGQTPLLVKQAEEIEPVPGIVDAISRVLDDRAEIKDNASAKLASIRQDLRIAKERLTTKLQRIIADPKIVPMLQEPIITQRDGRFVIPLRAEFKGRIESVVHDRSSSGATLFIEPLTVVDLNNRVRELELAERDEVRRLMAELSSLVGEEHEGIARTVEALAGLDLAFAKAKYADSIWANEPLLAPWQEATHPGRGGSTLRLLAARHPLLDREEVVPLDIILDSDTFSLVITGPNTGGKTVALKTTGLLALMAQCGLHIPAKSGSEISVFDGIFADIGDEQSIEQSLSTFSSHITNIIRIEKIATNRSLVLLDELGAGTDPQEGAALARAILSQFLEQGVTTLVATHYPELKAFAHTTPGVRNASVEFDLESLRPTYHLTIGLPGRSNALAIAERLGLDPEIVERARSSISSEELRAESLLDEIHRQKDATREALRRATEANEEVQRLRDELNRRLSQIETERRHILEGAEEQGQLEIERLRDEIAGLKRRLAAAAQPLMQVEALEDEAGDLGIEIEEVHPEGEMGATSPALQVKPGDRVKIQTINADGVITDLGPEYAEVQVGRLRIRARLTELSPPADGSSQDATSEKMVVSTSGGLSGMPAPPPVELDIRGQTVEGALDTLEKRLDAAFLAGMPFIRVIHGKGTGRLREAIRHALEGNEYVASFEPGLQNEGGDGVTKVKLATM